MSGERKPLRLKGWNYSGAGYYFVTVCTQGKRHLFWDGKYTLTDGARAGLEPAPTNTLGKLVAQTWLELPIHTAGVRVDKFVVMPNHFHGIVVLENGCVGAGSKPARTPLPEVVRQFKTFSARKINQMRGTPGQPVWQRSFYDHIIRNEPDYLRVWDYIDTNPARWGRMSILCRNKRKTSFLLAGLLLLAGCAAPAVKPQEPTPTPTPEVAATPEPEPTPTPEPTPIPEPTELWGFPIDDTHDAFEVPTGGKMGTVLVTVEQVEGDYEFINPAKLSVWAPTDLTEPIQVMDADGFTRNNELLDANFDGYMDFSYTWFFAAANKNDSLWLWDEETQKFVCGGEFLGRGIGVDEEENLIYTYTHGSAASGVTSIFHWEGDELIVLRRIETHYPDFEGETVTQILTVEDRMDGELTEVYRETFGDPKNGEIYDEAIRWQDLSYHGEP